MRAILSDVCHDPTVANLPEDTPLFREGLALSSLAGAGLLAQIKNKLGVDVAAQDLALESLATIGTLCAFVEAHRSARRSTVDCVANPPSQAASPDALVEDAKIP